MIAIAWGFIKQFAPYILIGMLVLFIYFAGGYAVQRKWDLREAELKAVSTQIMETAQKRVDDFKKTNEIAARIIGETYAKNEVEVKNLTATNSRLLDERLRSSRAGRSCVTLPSNTPASSTGNEAATDTWELSAQSARSLAVDEPKRADEIIEDCRAMQGYIMGLSIGGWMK
jgi:hypothetical protein